MVKGNNTNANTNKGKGQASRSYFRNSGLNKRNQQYRRNNKKAKDSMAISTQRKSNIKTSNIAGGHMLRRTEVQNYRSMAGL